MADRPGLAASLVPQVQGALEGARQLPPPPPPPPPHPHAPQAEDQQQQLKKEMDRKEVERKAQHRTQLRWDAVLAYGETGSYEEAALRIGKGKEFVKKWVDQHARSGTVDDGPRSGRPHKNEPRPPKPSTSGDAAAESDAGTKRRRKPRKAPDASAGTSAPLIPGSEQREMLAQKHKQLDEERAALEVLERNLIERKRRLAEEDRQLQELEAIERYERLKLMSEQVHATRKAQLDEREGLLAQRERAFAEKEQSDRLEHQRITAELAHREQMVVEQERVLLERQQSLNAHQNRWQEQHLHQRPMEQHHDPRDPQRPPQISDNHGWGHFG